MVLTTHAIVGASVANLMPGHPILGFVAGFTSHFLLDAIPHWDYQLNSEKIDPKNPLNKDLIIGKSFYFDLVKIGTDALLGISVSLLLFSFTGFHLTNAPLWGALGGIAPDALQFVYFKWRHEPFKTIQIFHNWIQRDKHLQNKTFVGITAQLTIIIACAAASIWAL